MKKSQQQMKKIILENSEFVKNVRLDEEFLLAEIEKSLEENVAEKTKEFLKK
jgi:hypothetical protein